MQNTPDVAYMITGKRRPTASMQSRHKELGRMKLGLRRLLMGAGGKNPLAPVSGSHYGRIKKYMRPIGDLRRPAPKGSKRKAAPRGAARKIGKGTQKQRDAATQLQAIRRGIMNRRLAETMAQPMPAAMPSPVLVMGARNKPYLTMDNAMGKARMKNYVMMPAKKGGGMVKKQIVGYLPSGAFKFK